MAFFEREQPDVGELPGVPLFEGVDRSYLAEIVEHTHRLRIKAGDVVMLEHFHGEQFLVIIEGRVAITKGGERVATLGVGDFIGEIGMLTGGDRTASVFAETNTKFLAFDTQAFDRFIQGHPQVRSRVEASARERGPTAAGE